MENKNELKGFYKGVAAAFIAFAGILLAATKL
jgi:hypothetical protein